MHAIQALSTSCSNYKTRRATTGTLFLLSAIFSFALTGCSPGGSDNVSDAGNQQDFPPIAAATVLNFSTTIDAKSVEVRAGTQVIVSAKDSDGIDDPILDFQWSVVNVSVVPEAALLFTQESTNAIAFMAPQSKVDQTLSVTLTVVDSDGISNTRILEINVVGIIDTNNYLVQKVTSEEHFYVRIPSTASGNYDLSIRALANWENLEGTTFDNDTYVNGPIDLSGIFSFTDRLSIAFDSSAPTDIKIPVPLMDADEINNRPQLAFSDRLELEKIATATLALEISYTDSSGLAPTISILDDTFSLITTVSSGTPLQLDVTTLRDDLQLESQNSAMAYYDCIDPDDSTASLSNWLTERNFGAIGTVEPGNDFAHAIYVNNYDLGFGRNMYMRRDTGTDDIYAYVVNHPSLQATVNRAGAFAVVAMDYSDDVDCSSGLPDISNKTVKFYAFVPDESNGGFKRAATMNFDGRGERALPGACTACHGGKLDLSTANLNLSNPAIPVFDTIDAGDLAATFMPWDLDSFLYTSESDSFADSTYNSSNVNPLTTAQFTREAQLAEFKKLNQMALDTYINEVVENESINLSRFITPIDLVNGWYGNGGCETVVDLNDLINRNCITLGSTYDGSYTPIGWLAQSDLYHEVFARNCRMCHTQVEVTLANNTNNFASYSKFISQFNNIIKLAFEEGRMPLSRLTTDRFWLDPVSSGNSATAADLLKAHLLTVDPLAGIGIPGQPVARIADIIELPVDNEPAGHDQTIVLDGSASIFADSFQWLTTTDCVNPQTLADPFDVTTSLTTSVITDESCAVTLTLEATDTEYNLIGQRVVTLLLEDKAPSAECFTLSPGAINLFNGANVGDGTLAIASFDPAGSANLGTLSAGPSANEVTYTLTDSNTIGVETFAYRLSDVNNTLSITGSNCAIPGSVASSVITVDSVSTATPQMSLTADSASTTSLEVSWSAFTGATYDLFRDNASIATDLATNTYTDPAVLTPNTFYNYTVQASVSGNDTPISSPTSYRTKISYDTNIVPSIVTPIGCIGCHGATTTRSRLQSFSCLTNDLSLSDCDSDMSFTITEAQRQLILNWRLDGVPN